MIFWRPYLSISIWPVGNSSIFPPALFTGFLRHTYTCHSAPYHGTVVTQVIVLHASITYVTLLRLTNVFILCSYNCFLTVIGALTVSSFCSKASQSRVKYSLPPTPPLPPSHTINIRFSSLITEEFICSPYPPGHHNGGVHQSRYLSVRPAGISVHIFISS